MATPATSALSEDLLLAAAGESSFDRGHGYVDKVHGLRVTGSVAEGSVQGRRVYIARLDWGGDELYGECTCAHAAEGAFCKHLVALGLRALDDAVAPPDDAAGVRAYLLTLSVDQLADVALELAAYSDRASRALQVRAAAARGDTSQMAEQLTAAVIQALSPRGFIDYRRSFDVAAGIGTVLDEIEQHLMAGAADAVRPALLKALTRLTTITQRADDSSGVLGDACQRSADLYARSCREGSPDPVKLAKWLVRFRAESPGWPSLTLDDVVAAFDAKALTAYRRGVAALDAARPAEPTGPTSGNDAGGRAAMAGAQRRFDRFEVERMLLELADHDGDVDRAVELLSGGEHPEYVGIVTRLRAAGRVAESMSWVDRAVAENRIAVTGPGSWGFDHPLRGEARRRGRSAPGAYWLPVDEVVAWYVEEGRAEDALAMMRRLFAAARTVRAYDLLLDVAERLGRREVERTAALEVARAAAERSPEYLAGAELILIALHEGDLAAAWAAQDEFGAGAAWQELATASADSRPGEAAALYRPALAEALQRADRRSYEHVAATLAAMRPLMEQAGEDAEFGDLVRDIRQEYRRRPSLLAALDAARLPR